MAQRKGIWLASTGTQVQSPASPSGLRIQCCHELRYRSQTWLWSRVAVAGSYSSNWTLSLGNSICHGCDSKKTKKKKILLYYLSLGSLLQFHVYTCMYVHRDRMEPTLHTHLQPPLNSSTMLLFWSHLSNLNFWHIFLLCALCLLEISFLLT